MQPEYQITQDDKERQQKIQAAWKAYRGEFDPPLRKMPGETDDNVLTNRCQPIVDRGVDFLFGKPLGIHLEQSALDSAPGGPLQLVEKIWGKYEARIPLLQKLAMSGAISGQAFLRIVPSKDGNIRLVVIDPECVFVQTAPQDCETVELYCIEYSSYELLPNSMNPQEVFYREEIKRIDPASDDETDGYEDTDANGEDLDVTWTITHWTRIGERGPWAAVGDPIVWNYDFSPIFSCQNLPLPHSFWGLPDLTPDFIGMNNSLNFVQSNINRINKIYGQPVLYATGVAASVIDFTPGRIIGLPSDNSKIQAVAISSDVANALAFADNLRSDMDEQSAVPAVALGRLKDAPRGNISGIALELTFMPLVQKTEKKRCVYGKLILDVTRALLVMQNFSEDIEISLEWQAMLPNDDLASVQAALAKVQLGVSSTTLISELGYDPDSEDEKSQAVATRKVTQFSRGQGLPPAPPMMPPQEPVSASPFIGAH